MRSKPPRSPATPSRASTSANASRWAGALVLMLMAVALEALPVLAWLETTATLYAGTPALAAEPFWFVYSSVLAAALLGTLYRRQSLPPAAASALVSVGWLAGLLVALRVSVSAYAGVSPNTALSLGWLAQVPQDVLAGSERVLAGVGLVLLYAYLWWRGLRLGREGATYDRLFLAFRVGLAAIVVAIIVAVGAPNPTHSALGGELAILLPLEVGVGLVGLTLSHMSGFIRDHLQSGTGQTAGEGRLGQTPWLLSAFGLAALVVGGALLLALVFSYDAVSALARALRPVGELLGNVLEWLIEGLTFLLFFLLNGVIEWVQQHAPNKPQSVQVPPPLKPSSTPAHPAHGLPPDWILAGRLVFIALVALVLLIILVRLLRRFGTLSRTEEFEETRESLDARSLLGAQLRALVSGLLPRRAGAAGEGLPSRSIRQLYRDMLRAALRAGRGRGAAETPYEYQRRLAVMVSGDGERNGREGSALPMDDLAALTGRYYQARYGEIPDQRLNQVAAQAESRRLSEWFAQHRRRG